MINLDESKIEVLKTAVDGIPLEKLSLDVTKEMIRSSRKLNETLRLLFIDFRNEKIIDKETVDSIEDAKVRKLAESYLRLYDYEILDENQSVEENENMEETTVEDIEEENYFNDDIKNYLAQIGKYPLLSANEEVELFTKYNNLKEEIKKLENNSLDNEQLINEQKNSLEQVRKNIANSNLKLVVSIAKRYSNRGLEFLDLIQEGNIGLITAIEKFDVSKYCKFSTYATWWIRQGITRAIADKSRTIRIPVYLNETIFKMFQVKRQLVQELHREPTDEEIAEEMDLPLDKFLEIKGYSQSTTSLDTPVGEEEHGVVTTILDYIEDGLQDVEKDAISLELRRAIEEVLSTLPDREAGVIRLRFGLDDDKPRTLEAVGQVYGVTREYIRQIESKAFKKLRHPARSKYLKGYYEEG